MASRGRAGKLRLANVAGLVPGTGTGFVKVKGFVVRGFRVLDVTALGMYGLV